MNEQLELLQTVVSLLDKQSIPYMVTGSAALAFYAEPRMTRDVDLVVELREADASVWRPRLPGIFTSIPGPWRTR